MNNINLHDVESINIKTREIGDDPSFVTNLRVTNTEGESFTISLFSKDLNSLFPFDLQLKESE
jgi:predicted nuclease of restriction endonuclease-like (RecB) superfamily